MGERGGQSGIGSTLLFLLCAVFQIMRGRSYIRAAVLLGVKSDGIRSRYEQVPTAEPHVCTYVPRRHLSLGKTPSSQKNGEDKNSKEMQGVPCEQNVPDRLGRAEDVLRW